MAIPIFCFRLANWTRQICSVMLKIKFSLFDRNFGMTFETIDAKWMAWSALIRSRWLIEYHFCKSIIETYSANIRSPSWKCKTKTSILLSNSLRLILRVFPAKKHKVVRILLIHLTYLLGSRICWMIMISFKHDFEHFSFSLILTYFPHL